MHDKVVLAKSGGGDAERSLVLSRGPKGVRFTDRGAMSLAIRRNMANISNRALGAVLLDPVSKDTVARCEIKCGAALQAVAHSFHAITYDAEDSALAVQRTLGGQFGADCNVLNCMVKFHQIRCDATNAAIWRHCKVHVLELTSVRLAYSDALLDGGTFGDSCEVNVQYADLQPLIDSSTAGTLGTVDKQLDSLGCRHVEHVSEQAYDAVSE